MTDWRSDRIDRSPWFLQILDRNTIRRMTRCSWEIPSSRRIEIPSLTSCRLIASWHRGNWGGEVVFVREKSRNFPRPSRRNAISTRRFTEELQRSTQNARCACGDEQTLQQTYFRGSARCVQSFDDSLDFAIRMTYRISLRSSSLWEPRHPLLKVLTLLHFSSRQTHTTPLMGWRWYADLRMSSENKNVWIILNHTFSVKEKWKKIGLVLGLPLNE